MALLRRTGNRFQAAIWPGFVDAMTALLLVLMFVLTIFMILQFMLRETITGQENELNELSSQVVSLADALGLERTKSATLESTLDALNKSLDDAEVLAGEQSKLIATLSNEVRSQRDALGAAGERITGFEAQVAELLARQETAQTEIVTLEGQLDEQAEAARLAAARRAALEALVADLESENADQKTVIDDAEAARLADAAAAEALRERLRSSEAELTSMTLALEERRKEAEETLSLLAAAKAAEEDLDVRLAEALLSKQTEEDRASAAETALGDAQAQRDALEKALTELRADAGDTENLTEQLALALAAREAAEAELTDTEAQAALLANAQRELSDEKQISEESQRRVALLNEQLAALQSQLGTLQGLLDASEDADQEAQVQLQNLGSQLNAALARAAAEGRKRRELEEAERVRLEAEAERLAAKAEDLEGFRSEFFGRLREVLGDQEGIRIEGDRFVFASEVLFDPASATLSDDGEAEIAKVAEILARIADEIPEGINWVIRVDGHTDDQPLTGRGEFRDNWELSQARALSVVRYMIDALGLPPSRLAANGFGEFQPVDTEDSAEARAQNRRIELKLTER